jgi:hypothetical protein
MNILEFKRKALGYTFRADGDYEAYTSTARPVDTTSKTIRVNQGYGDYEDWVTVPNPNYKAPVAAAKPNPEIARAKIASSLGIPVSSVVPKFGTMTVSGRDSDIQVEDPTNVLGFNVKQSESLGLNFDVSGNQTGTYTPAKPGGDLIGNLFAGLDSALGLSHAATVISNTLADVDKELHLSENAPAILAIAAAVVGAPYISNLISSAGATSAAATVVNTGIVTASTAATVAAAAPEIAATLIPELITTTAATTAGAGLTAGELGLAGGAAAGAGATTSGLTFSSLLAAPGTTIGSALGITNPYVAQMVGNTIIQTATNGGDVQKAIENAALSTGLSFVGSNVSGAVKEALKDIPSSQLSDTVKAGITQGVTGATTAAISGRDPIQALVGAASSTALGELVKQIPGYSDNTLSPEAKSVATAAVKAALTGKDVTAATLNSALTEGIRAAAGYADTALGLGPKTATAANPMSQDPAQRANANVISQGTPNNGYDLSALTNAGLSEQNLSQDTVADILNTSGEVQPGVVTAGLNTGVVSDAGGGSPELVNVRGRPIYSEDSRSASVIPPEGFEVLSAAKADNKPPGSYYNAELDAWLTPTTDSTSNLTDDQIEEIITGGQTDLGNTTSQEILDALNDATIPGSTGANTSSNDLTDEQIQEIITGGQTNLGDTTSQEILDALGDADTGDTTQSGGVFTTGIKGDKGERGLTGATGAIGAKGERGERGEAGTSQSPEEIRAIVDAALAANPNLTEAQVNTAINAAIANIPAGISTADVSNAINAAIANIPAGISNADVTNIVANATRNLATQTDVNNAIANIQFPAGISKADVAEQITTALAANPNLTANDVARSISDYMTANPGISAADVGNIVSNATQGLATAGSVEALQADLTKAINDANNNNASAFDAIDTAIAALKAAGLTEQQVQTIVDTSSGNVTKAFHDALNDAVTGNNAALDALQTKVAADISGVSTKLSGDITATESRLTDAIAANEAAGLTRDQATTKAIDDVAAQLGTTKADLLTQLGTTEEALNTKLASGLAGLETKVTDAEQRLSDAIQAAKEIGLKGDAALQAGLDSVASELGLTKQGLLSQLGTTEANLKTQFETSLAGVATKVEDINRSLTDAIAANEAAGLNRDQATAKAINDVAGQLNTTKADLLTQLDTTEAALNIKFATGLAGVETKLTDAEQRLSDAIQSAKDIGLRGDAALQAGINSVAAELGLNKEALLTQIGKTEADLRTEFQTGFGGVSADIAKTRTDLTAAIAANEQSGLTRDQATQKAVDDVASQLGTTKTELLTQLGTTERELASQVSNVKTELTDQLTEQGRTFMDALVAQGMDQKTALETAIAAQNKAITEGQATTQSALGELSAAQQKEVADRVAAGQATDAAIADVKATVQTGQTTLENKLNAQGEQFMNALVQQGMDQKTAFDTAMAAQSQQMTEGQTATNTRIDELMQQGLTQYQATQQAISELSTGFTDQLTAAEEARQADREAAQSARQADIFAAATQRAADQKAASDAAAARETARQNDIANQKAREAANLKTIQTGQIRGQMQTGLQSLMGGLQQQATQMAAPAQVETVKATPGFDFGSPLNVGFFGGYESQKVPPKDKESLKIATGGYLDDLLEAIR